MAMLDQYQVESNQMETMENLDQLWRPFLILARAIGVFPFATVKNDRLVRWWRNWWNLSSVFYLCIACFVFTIMIIYMCVGGVSEVYVGADYLAKCAYFLHVILSTATFLYFLNSKPYLNDLFRVWSSIRFEQNNTSINLSVAIKKKVKRNLVLTGIGCIIYVLALFGIHLADRHYENYITICYEVFLSWCLIANAIQLGLFCTVCCTSCCLFKSVCEDLEAKLAEESVAIHLKWFREVFMTVVDFVEISSRLFGRYVGFLVTFFLIETCCNTYLFFPYGKIDSVLAMACDLILAIEGLVLIIIVCLSAGEIAKQAGRPFRILLKLRVLESPSNNQIQELMLLLDCSKNLDVKICMFGIMPITKESLPMIFGIYLSYVFLLYQFPQGLVGASTSQTTTNCSSSI